MEQQQSIKSKRTETRFIQYVIVVHGIGDQLPNQTVLPVINRFAEARKKDWGMPNGKRDIVSLGKVAAQVGTETKKNGAFDFSGTEPWAQFDGIPSKRPKNTDPFEYFEGKRSVKDTDIRFVDFCWSDILDEHYEISGEGIEPWTDGVIERVRDRMSGKMRSIGGKDTWILKVLEQIQETALFAQKVAKLPGVNKSKQLDAVLNEYVGDIQIYGENRAVRGKAVLRFHNLMEKLHRKHCEFYQIENFDASRYNDASRYYSPIENANVLPRFTIISHSLGTVMALDAILYGHIKKKAAYGALLDGNDIVKGVVREFKSDYQNLPFEGYDVDKLKWEFDLKYNPIPREEREFRTNGEAIGSNWIETIDSFVTLGSPIDKYLTLWAENYSYLEAIRYDETYGNISDIFVNPVSRIRHYNYCDEQDPVGHHLDILASKPGYNQIFEGGNEEMDITFSKYQVPGVAHVKYWGDQELFERILRQTVDFNWTNDKEYEDIPSGKEFAISNTKKSSYWLTIVVTYFVPVALATITIAALFYSGWEAMKGEEDIKGGVHISWRTALISAVLFCGSAYFFKKLINLCIWWRQILRIKSSNQLGIYRKWSRRLAIFFAIIIQLLAILFSSMFIATALVNGPEDYQFAYYYIGILFAFGMGIFILSKLWWGRNWTKQNYLKTLPEWITVATGAIVSIICFFLIADSHSAIVYENSLNIPIKYLPALAILTSAFCVAWIYMLVSLAVINYQLNVKIGLTQRFVNWLFHLGKK